MRRILVMTVAVFVLMASLAGWTVFLLGKGLEDADRWTSVVGFFVNILLTTTSIFLAVQAGRTSPDSTGREAATGSVQIGGDNKGRIATNVTGTHDAGAGSVSLNDGNTAPISIVVTDVPTPRT